MCSGACADAQPDSVLASAITIIKLEITIISDDPDAMKGRIYIRDFFTSRI